MDRKVRLGGTDEPVMLKVTLLSERRGGGPRRNLAKHCEFKQKPWGRWRGREASEIWEELKEVAHSLKRSVTKLVRQNLGGLTEFISSCHWKKKGEVSKDGEKGS